MLRNLDHLIGDTNVLDELFNQINRLTLDDIASFKDYLSTPVSSPSKSMSSASARLVSTMSHMISQEDFVALQQGRVGKSEFDHAIMIASKLDNNPNSNRYTRPEVAAKTFLLAKIATSNAGHRLVGYMFEVLSYAAWFYYKEISAGMEITSAREQIAFLRHRNNVNGSDQLMVDEQIENIWRQTLLSLKIDDLERAARELSEKIRCKELEREKALSERPADVKVNHLIAECEKYKERLFGLICAELIEAGFELIEVKPNELVRLGENKIRINSLFNDRRSAEVLRVQTTMRDVYAALTKYYAVDEYQQNLRRSNVPSSEKLKTAREQFEPLRKTLNKRRDHIGITFLKVIGTILSLFVLAPTFWVSHGRRVADKMERMLDAPAPRP